jgi:hypothetical protein
VALAWRVQSCSQEPGSPYRGSPALFVVSGNMDVPTPDTLSALAELRSNLEDELRGLVDRHTELESELETLGKDIKSRQRALRLVKATEKELAAKGREGQQALEEGGLVASTQQVSASAKEAGGPDSMAQLGRLSVM